MHRWLAAFFLGFLFGSSSLFGQSFNELLEKADNTTLDDLVRLESASKAWELGQSSNSPDMKIDASLKLGELYLTFGQYNEAGLWLQTALATARKHTSPGDMGLAHSNLAMTYYQQALFDSAATHFRHSIDLFREITGQEGNAAATTLNLGMLKHRQGQYDEALMSYHDALKQFEALSSINNQAVCAHNIALIHQEIRQLSKAVQYFRKAINLWNSVNDTSTVAVALDNLGACYLELEQNDSAEIFIKKALRLNQKAQHQHWLSSNYSHLGEIYLKNKNWRLAKRKFKQALSIRKQLSEQAGMVVELIHLGQVYLNEGVFDSSLYYGNRAQEIAESLGLASESFEASKLLLQLSLNRSQDTNALEYFNQVLSWRDSLINEQVLNATQDAETKYQTEKKQQALQLAKAESALAQAQVSIRNKALIGFGIVLLLIAMGTIVIYRLARERQRQNMALNQANNEIATLMREVSHRVKNEMARVADIVFLSWQSLSDPASRQLLKEHEARIHSLNLVHQTLYQGDNVDSIKIRGFFDELLEQLIFSYGFRGKIVREVIIPDLELPARQVTAVALIIHEWVTNSLKYAFQDHPAPRLELTLAETPHFYTFTVKDNGPGFPSNTAGGFGLKLVSQQAALLGAETKTEVQGGACQSLLISKSTLA